MYFGQKSTNYLLLTTILLLSLVISATTASANKSSGISIQNFIR